MTPLLLLLTRRLLLAAAVLLSSLTAYAQAPTWQDAVSPGPGIVYKMAVDAAGNTYVTGSFSGTATFGATTLTSAGNEDVFVAKRTPAGTWLWATSAGGADAENVAGVAVDGSGNVVITGSFRSPTIAFGTTTLTNAGNNDFFVAKFTPLGSWQWANRVGGSRSESGRNVAVDGSGNVVVVGSFTSPTITLGSITLTLLNGGYNFFVAKLTPTGTWQWANSAGGNNGDYATNVAVDSSGNVVIAGHFSSMTITLGATTLTNPDPGSNIFVAKLTPTGVWQWAVSARGREIDIVNGMVLDGSGNVIITGFYTSPTLSIGAITLTNAGTNPDFGDVFVAKLTPTGAWQWATSAGGSEHDGGVGVAVDASGNVVVIGAFASPAITFGSTTLTSAGSYDIFVAKLTPLGVWQWATSAGGSNEDSGIGVSVEGSGSVVVTGNFASPTIAFGATTLTNASPGSSAIFLARLSGTTGLPETAEQPALTLFPNPARTTVQLTGATGATAALLDGLGRRVRTVPVSPEGAATLDVRALPAGLYLLRAGGATRRLVVE